MSLDTRTPDDAPPIPTVRNATASDARADQAARRSGPVPADYADWLADVKARVRATQVRAARAANTEVLRLYWSVGHDILQRQRRDGWGAGVIDRLSRDLRAEFPQQSGWSPSNLRYMRRVAQAWPTEDDFLHHVGGELPWRHITVLLDRLTSQDDRDWYAARAVAEGWKRSVLEHFIATGLRTHLGTAPTNFERVLSPPDSELARQLLKDPYVFEHLGLVDDITERQVEQVLMDKLQDTLTEFGRGMAFVGRQVRFAITDERGDTEELACDLLLYHIPQSRYVVVELKIGKFAPAYLGQLSAYVGLVDERLRDRVRQAPTIGLLLCTSRNQAVVRYTLANMSAALGVADYEGLPADARAALPTIQELQALLGDNPAAS